MTLLVVLNEPIPFPIRWLCPFLNKNSFRPIRTQKCLGATRSLIDLFILAIKNLLNFRLSAIVERAKKLVWCLPLSCDQILPNSNEASW